MDLLRHWRNDGIRIESGVHFPTQVLLQSRVCEGSVALGSCLNKPCCLYHGLGAHIDVPFPSHRWFSGIHLISRLISSRTWFLKCRDFQLAGRGLFAAGTYRVLGGCLALCFLTGSLLTLPITAYCRSLVSPAS